MKFDVFQWDEVKHGEERKAKGVLRVRCSASAPLYIEAEGYEVLASVGTAHEIDLAQEVSWRVDAPKAVRVFVQQAAQTAFDLSEEEVFTNIDRMPDESGSMAEVLRARRQFELERRSLLNELRAEKAELRAARKARRAEKKAAEEAAEDTAEAGAEEVVDQGGEADVSAPK